MHCRHLIGSLLLIGGLVIAATGCGHGEQTIPLPSSAKHYVPFGTLEPDQITIPFPWNEKVGKVLESWLMARDTSGHPVVTVTFDYQTIYSFPIEGLGANQNGSLVTLGGEDYRVVSIWVNTDEPVTGSGFVTLEPASSK